MQMRKYCESCLKEIMEISDKSTSIRKMGMTHREIL